MLRTLLLSLLIALCISSLPAKDKLTSHIENFQAVAKNAGSLDYVNNCSSIPSTVSYRPEKSSVYSALNNKTVELSVLSEKDAKELFKNLKEDEENSFNYPLNGCYARAHLMATRMDDMGIVSGKAFIEGDLYVDTKLGPAGWSYHVASLIMVKVKGKNVPTVIDPSIFDKPVSFDVWKAKLLKNKNSKLQSEYFTRRYNYDPDSRYEEMEGYLEDEIEDMKQTTRTNKIQGEVLERMYGDE